jgi:hypothetical protein
MAGRRRGKRVVASDGTVAVHGKNANGEGSVYRTKDGRWVAAFGATGAATTEPGADAQRAGGLVVAQRLQNPGVRRHVA